MLKPSMCIVKLRVVTLLPARFHSAIMCNHAQCFDNGKPHSFGNTTYRCSEVFPLRNKLEEMARGIRCLHVVGWRQSTWSGARHRSGTGRWRAAQSCTTKQWVHQLGRECVGANMHHTVAVLQWHPHPQLCDNLAASSAARAAAPGSLPFSCSAAPGRWMRCSMVCLVRLPHSPNISFSCPMIPAPNSRHFPCIHGRY